MVHESFADGSEAGRQHRLHKQDANRATTQAPIRSTRPREQTVQPRQAASEQYQNGAADEFDGYASRAYETIVQVPAAGGRIFVEVLEAWAAR